MFDTFSDVKYTIPQSSPMVRFVEYAKRPSENKIFLRDRGLHALWRCSPFSTVLQKPRSKILLATLRQMAICLKDLPPRRFVPDTFVCYCGRDRTYSKYPHPHSQWSFAFFAWLRTNSASRYVARFTWPNDTRIIAKPATCSRQNSNTSFCQYQSGLFQHCGYGYHRIDRLWPATKFSRWLQSQPQGTKVFLSNFSQRRQPQFDSKLLSTARQYVSVFWNGRIFARGPVQIAFNRGPYPHQNTSRFFFLRPKDSRLSRRTFYRICDSGQNQRPFKKSLARSAISSFSPILGLRRIPLSATILENPTPLYCRPQSQNGIRPDQHAFCDQRIFLSRSGDQPVNSTRSRLAFLLSQSKSRTVNPRTQKQFFFGQDSNSIILGQSDLLGDGPMGLRFNDYVQIPLSTRQASELEYGHHPQEFNPSAGRIGQTTQLQSFAAAGQLYTQRCFSICSKSRWKNKINNVNLANLQIRYKVSPSKT